jgi:hypothetical protein
MVSGPVAAIAASTAGVAAVAQRLLNAVTLRPSTPPSTMTISMSSRTVAAMALA